MHITNSNLVGGKINVIDAENRQKILVIEDTDNTTGIPYQNYRYIQSKALTEICVAIHPYGAVIISTKTIEMVEKMGIDLSKYHLQVKFGGNIYWIDLASLLSLESGADVTFVPMPADADDGENLDEELPPYSASEAGKYLKVNANGDGIEWADVPSELPEIEPGDGGKVLKVKDDESGTEWGEVEGGQSDGSGIRVSLAINNGTVESVYVNDEESSLAELFDYGWENVSSIQISEDSANFGGAFLLIMSQNLGSFMRVTFGTLSLPAVIPESTGYATINYVTIESTGNYTKAYSARFSITKYA